MAAKKESSKKVKRDASTGRFVSRRTSQKRGKSVIADVKAPRKSSTRTTATAAQIKTAIKTVTTTTVDRVHVVSHKDGWAVKKVGSKRASRVYDVKAAAINKAKDIVKKGKAKVIVIHKKDGTIQKPKSNSKMK